MNILYRNIFIPYRNVNILYILYRSVCPLVAYTLHRFILSIP